MDSTARQARPHDSNHPFADRKRVLDSLGVPEDKRGAAGEARAAFLALRERGDRWGSWWLAVDAASQGDDAAALKYFEEAIERGMSAPFVECERAELLWRGERYEELTRILPTALQDERLDRRRTLRLRVQLIGALRRAGRPDAALEEVGRLSAYIGEPQSPRVKNFLLNEREICERKTVLETVPSRLMIALTSRCNLRCIMCSYPLWEDDLPLHLAEEAIGWFPRLEEVGFLGGEAFLSPIFERMLEEAAKHESLRTKVHTAGVLVTPKWAERLARAGTEVTFSIDGTTKEVYEGIRKGGRFEAMLKGIDALREAREKLGSPAKANMTVVVMRRNFHQLVDFVEFAHRHGFESLELTPILDQGLAREENFFNHRDPAAHERLEELRGLARERAASLGVLLRDALPEGLAARRVGSKKVHLDKLEEERRRLEKKSETADPFLCLAPWKSLELSTRGAQCSCYCLMSLGDPRKGSTLADLWNGPVIQAYRKRLLQREYDGWCPAHCVLLPAQRHYHAFELDA